MKLYIVRHGQTEYNVKKLFDSNPKNKLSLTPVGIEQAKCTAQKLKDEKFDIIFVSQLLRSQETADIINENHKNKIVIDERLNDRRTGFQDNPIKELYKELDKSEDKWNAKFNDGESFEEEKKRIFSFLDDLKKTEHSSVLIVTHLEPIQIMDGYFDNLSNDEMVMVDVDNCGYLEFEL